MFVISGLKSSVGLRFEPFNEFGAAMSCERGQFRLRFAPINPEYQAEINSQNCQ